MSLAAAQRPDAAELIKRTSSRCPQCNAAAPAEVWKRRDETGAESVWMVRTCETHGEAEACLASDARFYWTSHGNPEREETSCCGGGCSGGVEPAFETLSTCIALIEIVHSCNLACPTCYANSPQSKAVDAVPLAQVQARIEGVIARKGSLEILQLSGGEPTLHPQFFELLAWCQAHPKIQYTLLNTNGVRIAHDEGFAAELGRTIRYGRFQLYLQFDGVQAAAQHALRAADLRATRRRVLEQCRALNIPVTLAMTVTPENLPHLWEAVAFGLEWTNVRGITFQPMFRSGRVGETTARPITVADIVLAGAAQSSGVLTTSDFTPLPCGDPNCATIGYLLKTPGGPRPISQFVDFATIQGFLRDRLRYSVADLAHCGCESEPLGQLLHELELDETHTFRLLIKPFMDAWTWDEDRIDRCCTHVIRPDGKLDSFCRYYGSRP